MTLKFIKQEIERATGLEDISSKSRKREYVIARCMFCKLAYKHSPLSYAKIGKMIKRDHATVIYSIDSLDTHLIYEPKYVRIFQELSEKLFEVQKAELKNLGGREKIIELVNQIPQRKYQEVIQLLEAI